MNKLIINRWLKESFAEFFQYPIHHSDQETFDNAFFRNEFHVGFKADSTIYTHVIHHHHMYDDITYNKGAALIKMVQEDLTLNVFRTRIQSYLKDFKFKTVDTIDFYNYINCSWLSNWIENPGFPVLRIYSNGTILQERFALNQQAHVNSSDSLWQIPLNFTILNSNRTFNKRIKDIMSEKVYTFDIQQDQIVIPNNNRFFYVWMDHFMYKRFLQTINYNSINLHFQIYEIPMMALQGSYYTWNDFINLLIALKNQKIHLTSTERNSIQVTFHRLFTLLYKDHSLELACKHIFKFFSKYDKEFLYLGVKCKHPPSMRFANDILHQLPNPNVTLSNDIDIQAIYFHGIHNNESKDLYQSMWDHYINKKSGYPGNLLLSLSYSTDLEMQEQYIRHLFTSKDLLIQQIPRYLKSMIESNPSSYQTLWKMIKLKWNDMKNRSDAKTQDIVESIVSCFQSREEIEEALQLIQNNPPIHIAIRKGIAWTHSLIEFKHPFDSNLILQMN